MGRKTGWSGAIFDRKVKSDPPLLMAKRLSASMIFENPSRVAADGMGHLRQIRSLVAWRSGAREEFEVKDAP
jgi:hypothetical protein